MAIQQQWRRFLVEWEAAKHYHMPYNLIIGWTFPNPLVEHILPSLLHVKVLAVLDEALETFIQDRSLVMPRRYRNTLEGRISFLADSGFITNDLALHAARIRRNVVAHELSASIQWETLASDVDGIEDALKHLGYVGDRPQMSYFGERSALQSSTEPGVIGVREFRIGVKEDDSPVYEARWEQKLYS